MSKIRKRLKSRAGMTLVELLCAVLILMLVSESLTLGTRFAKEQYLESMRTSQSVELYNTVQTILSNELRYTTDVQMDGKNVSKFYSVTYAIQSDLTKLMTLDEQGQETSGYGYLALGNTNSRTGKLEYNRILSNAAYTNGLRVKVDAFTYNLITKYFTVTLSIQADENDYISNRSFQVKALNL